MAKKPPREIIKAWREKQALSMRAAAPVIGVSVQTLLLAENGRYPGSVRVRERFAAVCGVAEWRAQ